MISKFQHRLLGMVILMVLAIIFLPWLLDGKKEEDINVLPSYGLNSPVEIALFVPPDLPGVIEGTKAIALEEKKRATTAPVLEEMVDSTVRSASVLSQKPAPPKKGSQKSTRGT